ncbi:MAG: hypothetical protein LBF16_03750 [Pseudomonadales bacterium]|jgi:hypothetical protein|nr:hypothetical protein [Pseudomonadales bacterium]
MIEPDALRALCQRIIQSGELGRSKTYAAILDYLVEQAIAGSTPKEVAIAMDVLGRDSDFDVGKDSIVRVHVYHLRNKLSAYYARYGRDEPWRIDIPKGQYMLTASHNGENREGDAVSDVVVERPRERRGLLAVALALVAIALLLLDLWQGRTQAPRVASVNPFAATRLWRPLLDDDLPILILVGDYYIMGETDAAGNVRRMVREFDINSRNDLLKTQREGRAHDYMNLDLSYLPTSVAPALAQVLKALGPETVGKRVQIKLMSKFSTTDLVGRHVVYLGYLSGLQGLTDLAFAASGLAFGMTYDELYALDDNTLYDSSSGLSIGETSYRDYGMLSTFPAPAGNQFVIIAGMRDEGLLNLSEEVTSLSSLRTLEAAVPAVQDAKNSAFEALYEVLGYDGTNFDAKLVYKQPLDTQVLWESRLIGGQ